MHPRSAQRRSPSFSSGPLSGPGEGSRSRPFQTQACIEWSMRCILKQLERRRRRKPAVGRAGSVEPAFLGVQNRHHGAWARISDFLQFQFKFWKTSTILKRTTGRKTTRQKSTFPVQNIHAFFYKHLQNPDKIPSQIVIKGRIAMANILSEEKKKTIPEDTRRSDQLVAGNLFF